MASYQAASVAGPLLAGVLVAFVRVESVLLVDAASFLASAASLALVRRSFNAEEAQERKRGRLRQRILGTLLTFPPPKPMLRQYAVLSCQGRGRSSCRTGAR